MRKLLLGLISIMLAAISIYMIIYGLSLGGLEIKGITDIQEANAQLDKKINEASKLKNTDYPQNIELLEDAYKKLMTEKENYEQILALGVDESGLPLSKIQEYEIEKIWVTIGNYADKHGVDVKMDITSNNSISKTYDLAFTVIGGYIQIADFLYEIERDNTLVFKIENFKLLPGGGGSGGESSTSEKTENSNGTDSSSDKKESSGADSLTATFVCKDIKLKIADTNTTTESNENKDNQTETDMNTEMSTDENNSMETEQQTNTNENTKVE